MIKVNSLPNASNPCFQNNKTAEMPGAFVERRRTQNRLLTESEAAKIARTTLNTVRYWRQTGRIAFIKPGRHPLIWASVLFNFLGKPESRDTIQAAWDRGEQIC
jgi:hypothetical protein